MKPLGSRSQLLDLEPRHCAAAWSGTEPPGVLELPPPFFFYLKALLAPSCALSPALVRGGAPHVCCAVPDALVCPWEWGQKGYD